MKATILLFICILINFTSFKQITAKELYGLGYPDLSEISNTENEENSHNRYEIELKSMSNSGDILFFQIKPLNTLKTTLFQIETPKDILDSPCVVKPSMTMHNSAITNNTIQNDYSMIRHHDFDSYRLVANSHSPIFDSFTPIVNPDILSGTISYKGQFVGINFINTEDYDHELSSSIFINNSIDTTKDKHETVSLKIKMIIK